MFRLLIMLGIVLTASTAEAQGNLSELFSILRSEGPRLSDSARSRTFEIVSSYLEGKKSLTAEWAVLDAALSDREPFVRDQACALLATLVYLKWSARTQPIALPETTRELVLQLFGDAKTNTRENAVRVIALMAGGVPPAIQPRILQMARTDPEYSARRSAIAALASINPTSAEITAFWVESLQDAGNKEARGLVLNSFRLQAPADPQVVSLVIEALKDTDRYVRQEAIAAIVQIGKPATSALPLLMEIRDSQVSDDVLRTNAASAIRILNEGRVNR